MSRRTPRSQMQALRRGPVAKAKAKDFEKWRNTFATRGEVDEMIRFYLDEYTKALDAAGLAVDAELPVDAPSVEGA